jgi:hypothetical protein
MIDVPTDESGAPPVTICCAASDGAAVRETADALVARGHQVELAIGVDVDQAVLSRSIAAQHGRGLYVLCRSHALDRNVVDQLREVLRSHDVPFGRTLTLAIDTQRPREVEERIVSVLRRMVTGRTDGRPRAWGAAPRPEDDPDTTVRRPGGSPSASDPGMLAGLGVEPEQYDPYGATSPIEVGYEPPEAVPYTGAEHTEVRPAPSPAPSPTPAALPFPPAPMPVPSASRMVDSMTAYTPPPVGPDEPSTELEEPLAVGGRVSRVLGSPTGLAVALGGLGIVALAIAGVVLLGGDDGEARPTASAAAKTTEAASKAGSVKAEPEAKAKPAAKPEPEAKPEPAAGAEPTEAPAPADEPRPAAAADPGDAALPARAFAPEDDPPDVVAALRSREVRAIDVWLVAPERKGTLTFDQAAGYCKELEVAGLGGWRVPAIGELNAVASAKMLSKAIFWSSTAGDSFGDLRLVLGTKKSTTIVAVSKSWDGAKIVCIRPRQP